MTRALERIGKLLLSRRDKNKLRIHLEICADKEYNEEKGVGRRILMTVRSFSMTTFDLNHVLFEGLPLLIEGSICPKVYHAGYGRYASFNNGLACRMKAERTDEAHIAYAEHFRAFGVQVDWTCKEPGHLAWTAEYGDYRVSVRREGDDVEIVPLAPNYPHRYRRSFAPLRMTLTICHSE